MSGANTKYIGCNMPKEYESFPHYTFGPVCNITTAKAETLPLFEEFKALDVYLIQFMSGANTLVGTCLKNMNCSRYTFGPVCI